MATTGQFVWRRGKQAAEHHGPSLTIGSRLPCELVLDDPVAAARHAILHFDGTRLELEPLPTATGTYVGGELVTGRRVLHEGDRLVIGVSRLEVAALDAIAGRIELALSERSFFFVAKQSREFHSDTDEWVRSEVRFGRMPRLRVANAIAAALGVALVLFALLARPDALSPGPLSDAHAWLLEDASPSPAVLASLATLSADVVQHAREQGCVACHGDDGRVEQARCVACHAELGLAGGELPATAPSRHPFELGERTQCTDCHREHGGALRPAPAAEPVACSACHDEQLDEARALAQARERAGTPGEVQHRERAVTAGFEAFDHGAHAALDCARCHGTDPDDRSQLAFELCAECHVPAGEAEATPVADLAWHGSDAGRCEACHEQAHGGALRAVEVVASAAPLARFRTSEVPHDDVLHARLGDRDCTECHVTGTAAAGGGALAAFRHEDHLSTLAPRTSDERARVLAECRACHTDMIGATGLVAAPATYGGPPADACVECHGAAGAVEAVATLADGAPRRHTPAFDHAAHADVEGACLACHAFEGTASNVPRTGAVPCRDCHLAPVANGLAHRHLPDVDAARCDACHAPAPGGGLAAVFHPEPERAPRSPLDGFSHHTPGHAASSCAECHGTPAPGTEVRVPTTMGERCTKCHAATRFHWR